MSSAVTLTLTVAGQIGIVPIGALSVEFALSGQTAGIGPQLVTVPAGAAPASVDAEVAAMSEQSLLFMYSSKEVTYQINSDGVDRTIKEGGFAIHPGDPVITDLAFGGNGSTDSSVTIIHSGTA